MWLETLTLQTNQSCREQIEKICRDELGCDEYLASALEVFFYQSSVLNVACHMRHETSEYEERSWYAIRIIALLQRFGPIHHCSWLPL